MLYIFGLVLHVIIFHQVRKSFMFFIQYFLINSLDGSQGTR